MCAQLLRATLREYCESPLSPPSLGVENGIETVSAVLFVQDGKRKERVASLIDQDKITEKISAYRYV